MSEADYSAVKKIEQEDLDDYRRYLKRTGQKDTADEFVTPRYFAHYASKETSFVAVGKEGVVGFILTKPIPFMHGEG